MIFFNIKKKKKKFFFFFFNDTATTEIYTLSLHDALPISSVVLSPTLGLVVVEVKLTNEKEVSTVIHLFTIKSKPGAIYTPTEVVLSSEILSFPKVIGNEA